MATSTIQALVDYGLTEENVIALLLGGGCALLQALIFFMLLTIFKPGMGRTKALAGDSVRADPHRTEEFCAAEKLASQDVASAPDSVLDWDDYGETVGCDGRGGHAAWPAGVC